MPGRGDCSRSGPVATGWASGAAVGVSVGAVQEQQSEESGSCVCDVEMDVAEDTLGTVVSGGAIVPVALGVFVLVDDDSGVDATGLSVKLGVLDDAGLVGLELLVLVVGMFVADETRIAVPDAIGVDVLVIMPRAVAVYVTRAVGDAVHVGVSFRGVGVLV